MFACSALNQNEIVILGGWKLISFAEMAATKNYDNASSDVYIFNTQT